MLVPPRAVEDFAPLAFALAQRVGLIPEAQPLPPRSTALTSSATGASAVTVLGWWNAAGAATGTSAGTSGSAVWTA